MARWQTYMARRLPQILPPNAGRRGPHHVDNYAWCCSYCNGFKGQRLTSRVGAQLERIFDPRIDVWPEHFRFLNQYLFIVGVSPIGVATQQVLGFNEGDIDGPLGLRHESIVNGRYPPHWLALP